MTRQLRPAQARVLEYREGKMAVSAVPGSGKTFTLARLAATLIAEDQVDTEAGQQILIVTYLNASVDTFKARIRQRLQAMDLPLLGFDVRTLHSLGLEIVRTEASGVGAELIVLDEAQADHYLNRAANDWIDENAALWRAFLPEEGSVQMRTRWRDVTERTAKSFIRAAKNGRFRPQAILARLRAKMQEPEPEAGALPASNYSLPYMLAGIYARYQSILKRQGAIDFDDLIWRAADLLETRPTLTETLRGRWPYVLEDEAQDSVPLQEALLAALAGPHGNWVRVGDPNQAITSTFTAAHPRFFNAFLDRADVVTRPLPNSGRCAPRIMGAANRLLQWVTENHPVPEVRRHTFRRQEILPTPSGDAQPNPPDESNNVRIKVYDHREEEELPAVARLAQRFAQGRPEQTVAILTPTNRVGFEIAERLDALDADYDNLLRGGSREREIAATMHALLGLLADPLDTRALVDAHRALVELDHPAVSRISPESSLQEPETTYLIQDFQSGSAPELAHFYTLLRSVHRPEVLLFPQEGEGMEAALPAGVASTEDLQRIAAYVDFLRELFDLRALPLEDIALALSNRLFATAESEDGSHEQDLSIAYQIAAMLRRWRELQPGWRLPHLVAQLGDVASGRRPLATTPPADVGFEPGPGRITLATQHGAKGLEWDAVFLVGIDGSWIPDDLNAPFLGVHDFLGGDPAAEATAQLRHLMQGDSGLHADRSATQSAHIEVICERLRLLYVGITRARRYLHISRSRVIRYYQREREAGPALALGVLYRYLQEQTSGEGPSDF